MEATTLEKLDQLVRDAISGDRFAFASLLETESLIAYRAALAILRSPDDARDVVQDAAIAAWQRLPELRRASAWPGWFRRIVVRTALDERRRVRRTREIYGLSVDPPGLVDPVVGIDDMLTIRVALARLPPEDRVLLGLRYGADISVTDVADVLGLRLGTAKARLHRAIRKLRKELEDDV